MNGSSARFRGMVAAILILGVVAFCYRGARRGFEGGGDLSMIYAAVTVWLDGGNPYRFEETIAVFRADGGDPDHAKRPVDYVSLYPASTFAALWPLGMVAWNPLHDLFTWLNVLMMIPLAWATVRMARAMRTGTELWLAIGLCLLLGPVHTTIAMGQVTMLCIAPLMCGLVLSRRGREVAAGVLLGYACALKPQLAGLFVLVLPFLGRWKTFIVTGIVSALTLAIGIGRMELAGIDWLPIMRANVELFTDGGTGDPRLNNPHWHLRMDLPMLLNVFTHHQSIVQAITWLVVGAMVVVACVAARTSRTTKDDDWSYELELLAWSIIAVATLLPVYHRFYDAVTLLIPFAWLFVRRQNGRLGGGDGIMIVMLCLFLLPNINVVIYQLLNPRLPESLAEFIGWKATVMACEVWALLIMLVVMTRRALSARPEPPRTAIPA